MLEIERAKYFTAFKRVWWFATVVLSFSLGFLIAWGEWMSASGMFIALLYLAIARLTVYVQEHGFFDA